MRSRGRLTLPVRALAVLAAATVAVTGCTRATSPHTQPGTAGPSSSRVSAATASSSLRAAPLAPTSTGPRRGSGTPVHVSLYEGDGDTYGVAMPIIAYFSTPVTDASVLDQVTTVTVNGKSASGAWFFENSSQASQAMEAHYRTATYWPAHATIRLNLPVAGLVCPAFHGFGVPGF